VEAMNEYWIVCFTRKRWDDLQLVAGPWYGWRGKRVARIRLKDMKTDPLLSTRPDRFLVKRVS
jgi:hypothetical protein